MSDIVVTVPKSFEFAGKVGLAAWVAEGDLPGEEWSAVDLTRIATGSWAYGHVDVTSGYLCGTEPDEMRDYEADPGGWVNKPAGEWNRGELGVDWVIVGGESGPSARPMHPDWAGSLRDQCTAAGVAFHFKQWGEWKPFCEMSEEENRSLYRSNRKAKDGEDQDALDEVLGRTCTVENSAIGYGGSVGLDKAFWIDRYGNQGHSGMQVFKVGKKAAGRTLDGRTWDEFPIVGAA